MTTFDSFIFFNELDQLEVRLNTLKDVVDQHILVEATHTISGLAKPLYFEKAHKQRRFVKFGGKLTYVVVDDMPAPAEQETHQTRLQAEGHQRNAALGALFGTDENDLVIVSDVDEILKPEVFSLTWPREQVAFSMKTYYYSLNHVTPQYLIGPAITPLRLLTTPKEFREGRRSLRIMDNLCWHFSSFGTPEQIALKLASFSHPEYGKGEWVNTERIAAAIRENRDIIERTDLPVTRVPLDDTLPPYILENPSRFKHWVYEE